MNKNLNEQKESSRRYQVWIPLIFSFAAIIGLIGGYKMAGSDPFKSMIVELDGSEMGKPGRVEELVRFIESRYVSEIDDDQLIEDAFQNVLSHLDPHSIYLKPDEMKALNEQMEGSFNGLGIESILLNDTLYVNHILQEGPAHKAGLQIGDQVLAINDSIIAGKNLGLRDIRAMLKGEQNEKVELEVISLGDESAKKVDVELGNVDVKSVKGFKYDEDLIVLNISRFSSDTYIEFMHELERLNEEGGFKNMIIDLRGNPGGFLPEATKILNQIFKEKEQLLVYTKGRNDRLSQFKSTGKHFYDIDKVAILVDEGSASGSEIIAGAIQDWDRGLIVGRRTFGKGLVQEQYELSNGGALRLTVAEYFTPSGRLIQKSYEDKQKYQDDIAERIHSGELTGDQSMPIMDSTVYKTMLKKRTVYGGGGISPDIYIPTDSLQLSQENILAKSKVSEFVFKKFRKGEITKPNDRSAFLKSWQASPQLITDFRGSLNMQEQERSWIDPFLKMHIKEEIGKLFYGATFALEVKLREDVFVQESINALSKQNIFAELMDQ